MTWESHPVAPREVTTFRRVALPAGLAVAAMVVAAYLGVTALREGARPLGCGNAGGCHDVFASHWARWGPIPIALLGTLVYAAVLLLLLLVPRCRRAIDRRRVWGGVVVLAMVILGAVAWLVIVQLAILRSVCLWCMTDHLLGAVLAGWLLCLAPWGRRRDAGIGTGLAAGAAVAALLGVAVLYAGQHLAGVEMDRRDGWVNTPGTAVPETEWDPYAVPLSADPALTREAGLPSDSDLAAAGARPAVPAKRRVSLSKGRIKITLPLPMLGPADAEHVIIELFDYACRHCRHMYHLIEGARERYGDDLAVVTLPVPLNPDCNRNVKKHNRGFYDACNLAELALAVWWADRESFPVMHAWLFHEKEIPSARDAREQAEKLVGAEALANALAQEWVKKQIRVDVLLHERTSGVDRAGEVLPKIIHKYGVATGLPTTTDELVRMLARTLGLRPAEGAEQDRGL